jgi:hypothetical protein
MDTTSLSERCSGACPAEAINPCRDVRAGNDMESRARPCRFELGADGRDHGELGPPGDPRMTPILEADGAVYGFSEH